MQVEGAHKKQNLSSTHPSPDEKVQLTESSLKKLNQFLKVSSVLVVVDEFFQLVSMDHNVETTHLG